MTSLRRRAAAAAVLAATAGLLLPAAAQAHSLTSSTVAVRVADGGTQEGLGATVSVAVDTLAGVLDSPAAVGSQAWLDEAAAYVDEHLTVTGTDGAVWEDTTTGAAVEQVEGISSLSVEVSFDTGGDAAASFDLSYDGVVEQVPSHEAVVVLTDAAGGISTPGVLDATSRTLTVAAGEGGTTAASVADMVGYGFTHVLAGADHMLFLLVLLLPAPLAAVAGRWQRRDGLAATLRRTATVVSCFTVGHLLTLVAATLGWLRLPSRPVEVLIAVSVAVAAVHAVRPLLRHGEAVVAGGFGLVHGLAFATVLAGLGLEGRTSAADLLAFNLGVEAAQLSAVALVLPSLYLASRTRWYPALRVAGALLALAAAATWVVDRVGLADDPFAGVEAAAVARPLVVVGAVAAVAGLAWLAGRTATATGQDRPAGGAEVRAPSAQSFSTGA